MTQYLFDNINTSEIEKICVAECDQSPDGAHCWHAGDVLLVTPPRQKIRCCWCGKNATQNIPPRGIHGTRAYGAVTNNATMYFAEFSDLLQPQLHICGRCGAELDAVRPGKWQCPNCE